MLEFTCQSHVQEGLQEDLEGLLKGGLLEKTMPTKTDPGCHCSHPSECIRHRVEEQGLGVPQNPLCPIPHGEQEQRDKGAAHQV